MVATVSCQNKLSQLSQFTVVLAFIPVVSSTCAVVRVFVSVRARVCVCVCVCVCEVTD